MKNILLYGSWSRGRRNQLLPLVLLTLWPCGLALQAQTEALPDLIVDAQRLQASMDFRHGRFRSDECVVVEGCAEADSRRTLLRFDVATANLGPEDVVLGAPTTNSNLFVFSPCHGHYHFNGFALYELLDAEGATVVAGRKQAFCLLDYAPYSSNAGPSHGYNCNYQGITAGWQDVYIKRLDCQWLDVTGVPPGDYILKVTVNPEGRLIESDYSNNSASVLFTIPAKGRGGH